MKIAIVTETFLPATDGIVTRLTRAIDYMLEVGHEVIILAPEMLGIPSDYEGAPIYSMPAKTFFFYEERPWALPTRKVKEIFREFQPDIVHAVNPLSLGASAVHYASDLELPLICSFHTNIPNYLDHYHFSILKPTLWSFLRKLHNTAPVNLVTSQAMADLLDENGINGIQILPKGVDVINRHPRFKNEAMRNRLSNHQADKKLLIFVGRLAPEKNIKSLRELLERRKDVCLAIVGDGPDRKALEEHFTGTNTVFTGFLHGEELSQAYASADAFVFPSTSETLGLVITESMASGTPVIAAYSEPTAEQIVHQENGFIYQGDSLESLNDCIDLLGDHALINQVNSNARDYAKQFSWENASKAMVTAYEEVLSLSTIDEKVLV